MHNTTRQYRLRSIVIKVLLAMTMVVGSFATAIAQGTDYTVMLPLIQTGTSVSQAIDGPFARVSELSDISALEANEALSNDTVAPEVTAASCYSNATTYEIATEWSGWRYFNASNRCSDLNVTVSNWSQTDSCNVYVYAYYRDRNGNWIAGSGNFTAIGAGENVYFYEWFEPITSIIDGTTLAVAFYAFEECGISQVRVAA